MKIKKTFVYAGLCALLLTLMPTPTRAEEADPGTLVTEWKEQGHLTTYGMIPIHGTDVNDGTWSVEGNKLHSTVKFDEVTLSVKDGEMILTFTAEKEKMDEKLPEWENKLELKEVSGDEKSMEVNTVVEADTVRLRAALDALNQDYTLTAGNESAPLWVDAATLPEEALKIDLPDYSVIRDAMNTLEAEVEENRLVNEPFEAMSIDLPDGEYAIEAQIFGGSGKAAVDTPTYLYVRDGKAYARLRWSSSSYDYMIVGGQRYENEAEPDKNSIFIIPIKCMDEEMTIVADTLAMGTPHEIIYGLTFSSSSIGDVSQMPQEAAKRVVVIAFIIIIGGGILNHYVKKKRGVNTGKKKKKQ